MNIESFTIGIMTVVVFGLTIATILGILKVTALARETLTLKRRLEDDERELSREINMVDKTLQNQIEHRIHDVYLDMQETQRGSAAYTDKRIDKLIDTYFDIKKNGKQIIKD